MPLAPEFDDAKRAVFAEMASSADALRGTLDAEREALDQLDPIALDAATAAKSGLLQRLESLDAERRQLDDLASPPETSGAWQRICRQLEACRRINETNGSIVEHQLRGVRRALGILRGAGEGPPVLYGPGGHADAPILPRSLSKA
ncbi:MAG: flagella synthesis protein FlgN [Rhodanobacteraceae bacterium]